MAEAASGKYSPGLLKLHNVYIDDTYTISNSFSDHIEHLRAFLSVIKNAGFTLPGNEVAAARGLRNSLGYFSHVKHLTIDIDIDKNTNNIVFLVSSTF